VRESRLAGFSLVLGVTTPALRTSAVIDSAAQAERWRALIMIIKRPALADSPLEFLGHARGDEM
jgi:hypothetical protein